MDRAVTSLPSEVAARELALADARMSAVLDSLVAELRLIDGVTAILILGSIADGSADEFSDLDLQCQVVELSAATAEQVRSAVARTIRIGDERWTIPATVLSTVSTDWIRVDVSMIGPSEATTETAIVVWRAADGEIKRGPATPFGPNPDRLTRTVTRFLRSTGLIVRDLHRGDLRLGCFATEFLVEELISLMYLERGLVRGAQKGTYSRLDEADVAVLQALPVATPHRESIIAAHIAVAEEFLQRAHRLAQVWGAEWPHEMTDGTRRFLEQHLGTTFRVP